MLLVGIDSQGTEVLLHYKVTMSLTSEQHRLEGKEASLEEMKVNMQEMLQNAATFGPICGQVRLILLSHCACI